MQEHERNRALTNQAISNLLDFGSLPPPQNDPQQVLEPSIAELLKKTSAPAAACRTYRRPVWQRDEDEALRKQISTTGGKAIVVAAWVILVLIVGAVIGRLGFRLEFPPSIETVQRNSGYLFHISMLALAGCVLSLTTWLYWKDRLSKVANIVVVVVIVLSGSLPLMTMKGSGSETAGMKKLRQALFNSSSNTMTPMGERVTGILHSKDKPSAVIGYRIVHEKETIRGVEIVKIHKDKVEFEKDGKRWTQTIQGAPTAYWE